MNRTEFTKEFATAAELTIKDTKEILKIMENIILTHIKDEDGVTPMKGMKFYSVHRDERVIRNPQTGEPLNVSEKNLPKVRFGKNVKDALN